MLLNQDYCEFSGGGDILVTNKSDCSSTSVISVDILAQRSNKGLELSPTKSGTFKVTTLSIECKTVSEGNSYELLLCQLYANMVSASVQQFFS